MKRIRMEVTLTIDIDEDVDPKRIDIWAQDIKLLYPTSKLFNIYDQLPEKHARVVSLQLKQKVNE